MTPMALDLAVALSSSDQSGGGGGGGAMGVCQMQCASALAL